MKKTIHLIANAHLDPVWLWDRREGLNEGITTVRTMLDLMDEFPEMTFIRGEAAIYQQIEKYDPATFARIKKMVKAGRWDVVGGTYIQPDTNLPAPETLVRHYAHGQRYFTSRFGKAVTAGWQADSFGHSAGLPEILSAGGINFYAFCRPAHNLLSMAEPAFWWLGDGGARILAYRLCVGTWYGCERDEMPRRLDAALAASVGSKLDHVACFYGLGNHGGGPSRRHLQEIREWVAKHPEVEVIHSGLHRLNDALRKEIARKGEDLIPTHKGELNYCLRGCYSSVAKFKFPYRRSEALLSRAESTDAIVAASQNRPAADLSKTWDVMLLNSFHDILPGSSIERAMDDQIASLGSILHDAAEAEFEALNQLAADIDTTLTRKPPEDHPSAVTALVWNPHPFAYEGPVELEANLDYRPIFKYTKRADEVPIEVLGANRKPVPFQVIHSESLCFPDYPSRKRVLLPVRLPAFGWNVVELGWVEGAKPLPVKNPVKAKPGSIANALWRVEAKKGGRGVQLFHHGKKFFAGAGLQALLFKDPWGSWGGMFEEPASILLKEVRERWTITQVELLEKGPERAALWVRFAGENSRIDLTFHVSRDRDAVDVSARVLLDDRSARLKLVFPAGDQVDYEVPGSVVRRGPAGEVPGARWARVDGKNGGMGFASDALYNFDSENGEFRATVARASRYANDVETPADAELWRPAVDCGELKFRFLITGAKADLPRLAAELEQPPVVLAVPPRKGKLRRTGSLMQLAPASVRLLAIKGADDGRGFLLRAQAVPGKSMKVSARWLGKKISLGSLQGGAIATWRLEPAKDGWKATPYAI